MIDPRVLGLMFLTISFMLKYENPKKDESICAYYFTIYSILIGIGVFLLTFEMGNIMIYGFSFPPFLVLVPLGTFYILLKLAERWNDPQFIKYIADRNTIVKNYFISIYDRLKDVLLDIRNIPIVMWNLVVKIFSDLLTILKIPYDAFMEGYRKLLNSTGDIINANVDGFKNALIEIKRGFKLVFVDALWEIVSIGGEICCSVLPPPFNKSTKCANQKQCMKRKTPK
jgi:hypothetical protein